MHTLCAGSLQFLVFLRYESVFFLNGASQTSFLRPTFLSKIVWRVPHVVPSMMVKNRTQFVKQQVQTIFENTHWCVTCVVVAASSHSVFNHVRDRGIFRLREASSIALEHAITTARYMTSIFSVKHPSSCRFGKCQSRGVINMSVPVFRISEKLFFLPFSWFTEWQCRLGQDVVS